MGGVFTLTYVMRTYSTEYVRGFVSKRSHLSIELHDSGKLRVTIFTI